jgi:gliding motility-associated-like protein
LDPDDKVYIFGQSQSSWPITPGLYGNPNSGQFIQKYSTDLNTIEWTTMIGAESGNVEISPTAFLVSDCYEIYLSGWGGVLNQNTSVSQAAFSSTVGFPVTTDAFQTGTNGSNFYIAVLGQDASSLEYGTFMGGMASSSNHVDGGTSRFDKSGRIYHAVCGACGGNDFGFTSTPESWAPANPSPNCNLAAFKFELNEIEAIVSEPEPLICLPDPVVFNNNSANGNTFTWNFGDGTSSNDVNPVHYYAGSGIYTVTLVVSDSNGCFTPDSVSFEVNIGDFEGGVLQPTEPVCPGESFQLEAFGGSTYLWSPAQFLDDPTSATPTAVIDVTTVFTVVVSDSCGIDTAQLTLQVTPFTPVISNDTSICIGNSAFISVSDGILFQWTPSTGLSNPTIQAPIATPDVTTTYTVETTSPEGCVFTDEVTVSVYYDPPIPVIPETVPLCEGSSVEISVSGGESYVWSPNQNINTISGPVVIVSPVSDMYYYCDFFNACGFATDSVFVDVVQPEIIAGNDTIICPGQVAYLWADGGVAYSWSPTSSVLGSASGPQISVRPFENTIYSVTGTDQFGCTAIANVQVDLFPLPFIQASPDVYAFYGDEIILTAQSSTSGVYIWSPTELVSCVSCSSPTTSPDQNVTISVTYTDENGCTDSDSVKIFYDPVLYVPNTFTPDGNEFNNEFRIYGGNISSFECLIFNRWGELLYTISSFEDYWDGTYEGILCQDGTYTWKLRYYGFGSDEVFERTGHVNLIR